MSHDEIISMARDAGFVLADNATDEAVNRFRRLIVLAKEEEREACAKVCDQTAAYPSSLWEEAGCWNHAAECCASAIRARGEPE